MVRLQLPHLPRVQATYAHFFKEDFIVLTPSNLPSSLHRKFWASCSSRLHSISYSLLSYTAIKPSVTQFVEMLYKIKLYYATELQRKE